MQELGTPITSTDVGQVEEIPIPVAERWDVMRDRSEQAADLIDRHLDFETRLQGRRLRPVMLCPEQRVGLMSDLSAV